uniref:Uncharacterized protein n=1 Tax=Globisporangium ultimum (strain ATCC 200006 / CBS 805.95 / DAOM BR144) TaxID=431595 RepID=K3WUM7_GLOUD
MRSPRTGLGKRGGAAGSESDATTSQGSPTKSVDTTPIKRRTIRKQLFVKGSTIYLQDSEAKVAAVEGNFIRVHYKGQSAESDEWLPINSKELRERIVTISPPRMLVSTTKSTTTK